MYANNSDLLSQINCIIQNSPLKQRERDESASSIHRFLDMETANAYKDLPQLLTRNEIKKIEERIEKLEDQNDQLICIIQFLLNTLADITNGSQPPAASPVAMFSCHICPDTDKPHSNSFEEPAPFLTKREMDVFRLLSQGLCAKEIAKALFISESTVITHKRNLKVKFHAKNTVELISAVLGKINSGEL